MFKFIYQASPIRAKYKSLGYAVQFAKALSGDLSVKVGRRSEPRFSAFKTLAQGALSLAAQGSNTESIYDFVAQGSSHETPDLIMAGKRLSNSKQACDEISTLQTMYSARVPVLLIPYGYALKGVQNILFAGNAPGLMDEPLLHRLISVFLPRAWHIKDFSFKRIHWNNVSLMPPASSSANFLPMDTLAQELKNKSIDLILTSVPQIESDTELNFWTREMIGKIQVPILLFPSKNWRQETSTEIAPLAA